MDTFRVVITGLQDKAEVYQYLKARLGQSGYTHEWVSFADVDPKYWIVDIKPVAFADARRILIKLQDMKLEADRTPAMDWRLRSIDTISDGEARPKRNEAIRVLGGALKLNYPAAPIEDVVDALVDAVRENLEIYPTEPRIE